MLYTTSEPVPEVFSLTYSTAEWGPKGSSGNVRVGCPGAPSALVEFLGDNPWLVSRRPVSTVQAFGAALGLEVDASIAAAASTPAQSQHTLSGTIQVYSTFKGLNRAWEMNHVR